MKVTVKQIESESELIVVGNRIFTKEEREEILHA